MSQSELFSQPPLAFRLAPERLEDFVGQEHILGPGKSLRRIVEADALTSAVFFGPPGTGKTALANIIAARTKSRVERLNAATAGVADLKKILSWPGALLVLDEIHHFNRTQQDVLLPAVERGDIRLIGLTSENPYFYVNAALISRFTVFEFKPLSEKDLSKILDRALQFYSGDVPAELEPAAREHLLKTASGDARRLLNGLQVCALSLPPGGKKITLELAEESAQKRVLRYDKSSGDHYDHISAFIKSMRGSDPDAAVYWMAKMLSAGEDPRFVARRILICASEDVGNADPRALVVAAAALQAVEFVGMPEAKIPLAQAALYVACAPKSNAAYKAVSLALEEVEKGPAREVPLHLKDPGKGYKYPHDYPGGRVEQEYLPNPKKFYFPSEHEGRPSKPK